MFKGIHKIILPAADIAKDKTLKIIENAKDLADSIVNQKEDLVEKVMNDVKSEL